MRVLICPDRMGVLSSAQAGRAIAVGWPGSDTRPVGESGVGFVEATADGWQTAVQTGVLEGLPAEWAVSGEAAVLAVSGLVVPTTPSTPIPYEATSLPLGRAVATIVREHRPRRLLVDLGGLDVHDAGAGLLSALGASATGGALTVGTAGLSGLTAVDLAPAERLLDGVELVGVVPTIQRDDLLLGLRGITSRRGRAADEDAAVLLATDAALQNLTQLVDPKSATRPGAGACGGLGWAVMALGGLLTTGPGAGLSDVFGPYDLVVTGCPVFDFATRGGGVVAAAAEFAAEQLAPCLVIAGEVLIGGREMRTMGIEAAYPIFESGLEYPAADQVTERELVATVTRVSRSWRW